MTTSTILSLEFCHAMDSFFAQQHTPDNSLCHFTLQDWLERYVTGGELPTLAEFTMEMEHAVHACRYDHGTDWEPLRGIPTNLGTPAFVDLHLAQMATLTLHRDQASHAEYQGASIASLDICGGNRPFSL